MENALTIVERAAVALHTAEHEKRLVKLAKISEEIFEITNAAGYQQCHSARTALKRARIEIEKVGKTAREDAYAFSKAVIAEEKRLIAIIKPEEDRLQALQDEHDAKAKRIEEERVVALQARLDEIKNAPNGIHRDDPDHISGMIDKLREMVIDESFQEFQDAATTARDFSVSTLQVMHRDAISRQEEQRRIAAEREELARLRAEQEKRQREEAARIAEETRKRLEEEAAARRVIEEEQRAARLKIEEEERQARLAREEADRQAKAAREAEEEKLKAERDRLDKERRAIEEQQRKEREAQEAKERAERQALEAAEREVKRKEAERADAWEMLDLFVTRYGHMDEFKPVVKAIKTAILKREEATQA